MKIIRSCLKPPDKPRTIDDNKENYRHPLKVDMKYTLLKQQITLQLYIYHGNFPIKPENRIKNK